MDDAAGEDAGEDETSGDEADLTLHRPSRSALDDPPAGRGEPSDAGGEDVQVTHAGTREPLASLVGADPGLADQDDLAVEAGGQGVGVLANQLEGQVVGARDVAGLELGRAADVEDGDGLLGEPVDDGGGVDLFGGGATQGLSPSAICRAVRVRGRARGCGPYR